MASFSDLWQGFIITVIVASFRLDWSKSNTIARMLKIGWVFECGKL